MYRACSQSVGIDIFVIFLVFIIDILCKGSVLYLEFRSIHIVPGLSEVLIHGQFSCVTIVFGLVNGKSDFLKLLHQTIESLFGLCFFVFDNFKEGTSHVFDGG